MAKTPEQVQAEQAQDRLEEQVREDNKAMAVTTAPAPAPAPAPTPMTQDALHAAADAHAVNERAHFQHERRMQIINTGAGEPRAFPTPDWHPLDVPQPQTSRPVEPTPHTVPWDAQR